MRPDCGRVHAGVCVVVRDASGALLLIERKGSHGAGTWGLVGGHIDQPPPGVLVGETPEEACVREAQEELGMVVAELEYLDWTFDHHPEGFTGLTLFYEAHAWSGPTKVETEKIEAFGWFLPNELPAPLFAPLEFFLKSGGLPSTPNLYP